MKETEDAKRPIPIIRHNADGSIVVIDSGTTIVKAPAPTPTGRGGSGGGAAMINGKFIVIPPR